MKLRKGGVSQLDYSFDLLQQSLGRGERECEAEFRDSESGEGKVVCMTGASVYIASWVVKHLLQCGYTVKDTVRDPDDPKKIEHLLALEGAKERLLLFNAHLLEVGSFDSVADGCNGVFHTASPVVPIVDNPQEQLIGPALKGTMNVLRSCAKVPSV
ncbi:Tetraketide alpha-pyrone reductase 1 [Vitis vinifera]|uniref:Tetraketide alpha-pyrone reductase 1 n=1 Tax=Vitis vinifera TaxID=29760 RepID=A0A438CHJ8_VITVI|nr:Tetraketide alpha-pyrone reductase 1 [Vitis vinifera]